jgi:hypothetical protein
MNHKRRGDFYLGLSAEVQISAVVRALRFYSATKTNAQKLQRGIHFNPAAIEL